METKPKGNASLTTNCSSNCSSSATNYTRQYVFAPVSYHVKLILFTLTVFCGVYGFVANSLVLYCKYKGYKRYKRGRRAFTRHLTEYFIQSLALSDILNSVLSLPLFTTNMLVDFVKLDWICRLNSFIVSYFMIVTILNLLVVGVERYFAIFHPFSALSRRKAKKMVMSAWGLAFVITCIFVLSFRMVHYDIGENFYTRVCKYDSSIPLYRAVFVSVIFITYIVPSFLLTFVNIRILYYRRNSLRQVSSSQIAQRAISHLKVTRMFVSLIFAFVVPHVGFAVYYGLDSFFEPSFSFTSDYISRFATALIMYTNAAISATILIYYDRLYQEFIPCFQALNAEHGQFDEASQAQTHRNNDKKIKTSQV